MRYLRIVIAAVFVFSVTFGSNSARAAEKIDFILNWIAGGDHAPYYYALQEGWYAEAGIELDIQQGKGSGMSAQRTGIGKTQVGLADLGTALVARGKGADLVAVMNIYANSPYGMYWLKDSGIKDLKDMAGKKIGNPSWDAARQMWPALAKSVGMDPKSVTWVNIQPNAKLPALISRDIDITTSFYNIHHIFQAKLGDNMGFFPWKEYGVNPYGNSIIVNGSYLKKNPDVIKAFVRVNQKAFHTCVLTPDPCIQALVSANTGLKFDNEKQNWGLVTELMTDEYSTGVALGYFDPGRMDDDYKLIETYFKLKEPFDIKTVYTNDMLDRNIKMKK
ncbi:MAG: ABC transporter substrate-binding protein [SAR324 cluster bacterium]|nr:ABC transporter substrate-binding protein [SAR324 cluster bacterium]